MLHIHYSFIFYCPSYHQHCVCKEVVIGFQRDKESNLKICISHTYRQNKIEQTSSIIGKQRKKEGRHWPVRVLSKRFVNLR